MSEGSTHQYVSREIGFHSLVSMQMYNLSQLGHKLQKEVYKLVTECKFTAALDQVNIILHLIPLTMVETRREVDELKELLGITK